MAVKVCLHISSFGPGGAERQIVNLARALANRDIEVILLHEQPTVEDAYYLDAIRERGVKVISILAPEFLKRGMLLSRQHAEFFAGIPAPHPLKMGILFLAGALSSLKPDIVHSYLDIPNCTSGCATVLAGVPAHLGSFRSMDPATAHYSWEGMTYPLYRYLLLHGRSRFEANSRLGAEHYARWLDMDSQTIAYSPNGLDPEVYVQPSPESAKRLRESLGIPVSAPVLLTLGRFCPEKAPETMLDIFARVHAMHPEARYLIAGTGMTPVEEMGAMVGAADLEDSVHLLGVQSDVAALFSAADIFLLPSKIEGFPNAVMEAMAAGLPVVASNVGGVPDLVRHGQDGFLHQAQDTEGMAGSVLALLANPKMQATFGENARQRMLTEFSLQKLGDRVIRKYGELLVEKGKICD